MSHEHFKSDVKTELTIEEAIQALDIRVKILKAVREREPDDLSAVWSYTTAVDKYSRLVREAVEREEAKNGRDESTRAHIDRRVARYL
jgi:prefoldin subunit 5